MHPLLGIPTVYRMYEPLVLGEVYYYTLPEGGACARGIKIDLERACMCERAPCWPSSQHGRKPAVWASMDIGKDVLTRTLLGSTEAEKVFTPWWITVHHYLVYSMVILGNLQALSRGNQCSKGLIAVPINCMLGVNGNCSYKFSSRDNYVLPFGVCRVENSQILVEKEAFNEELR